MSDSLWPHGLQHARFPCPSLSLVVCLDSCPLTWWCYLTVSSSATLFSFCPQSFPASGSFLMSHLYIMWLTHWSFSCSISLSKEYSGLISWISPYGLVGSPCSPRDSQESSPTPQFKSINSLVLSLFHDPTLTSVHDYWKNHSFDYMDLFQQSDISAF